MSDNEAPENMSAKQLVNKAFQMLLEVTARADSEVQNAIIGAAGLLESAEYRIDEMQKESDRRGRFIALQQDTARPLAYDFGPDHE